MIPRSTTRSIIRWCQHTLSHVITKVGQTASSSVAEKSPQRLLSLQQISEKSRRRRGDVSSVSSRSRRGRGDVAETSRRRLRDLLETERSLKKKNRTCLIFRDSPETRLVSGRLKSPTSLQAGEIGPLRAIPYSKFWTFWKFAFSSLNVDIRLLSQGHITPYLSGRQLVEWLINFFWVGKSWAVIRDISVPQRKVFASVRSKNRNHSIADISWTLYTPPPPPPEVLYYHCKRRLHSLQ